LKEQSEFFTIVINSPLPILSLNDLNMTPLVNVFSEFFAYLH